MQDIRDSLFKPLAGRLFRAVLLTERAGVLAGTGEAKRAAAELGLNWETELPEGSPLDAGQVFATLTGTPKQLAEAEERIIGTLSKPSGIATAAARAVALADGQIEIVSGSWKKMPPCMKQIVRGAITTGGASFRICEPPMLYMDKNFVAMFGSVAKTLKAAAGIHDVTKIIQIRGERASIAQETEAALAGGADILMVDTGEIADFSACTQRLNELHAREKVRVAFAGNVKIGDIPAMAARGVDILCIGKEIVDAPLLDMKLNVIGEVKK